MELKRDFYVGISILVFLIICYFIPITIDSGINFSTKTSLLALIIFKNPFILAIYVLIAVIFLVRNFSSKQRRYKN